MSIKFKDNSQEILSKFGKAKDNALTAIGMTAEGYAKDETPVDTGRLRNSMANAVDGDSVYIGSNVVYAPYVELGTRSNVAHHMLQKAATNHSDEYKRLAENEFKNA